MGTLSSHWNNTAGLPPPEWLLQYIRTSSKQRSAWDERILDSNVQGVALGERDSTGYRLACRWLAKGFTPIEVEHFLLSWAASCQPPMGDAPGDPRPEVWAAAKVASAQIFLSNRPPRVSRERNHKPKPITGWEVRG